MNSHITKNLIPHWRKCPPTAAVFWWQKSWQTFPLSLANSMNKGLLKAMMIDVSNHAFTYLYSIYTHRNHLYEGISNPTKLWYGNATHFSMSICEGIELGSTSKPLRRSLQVSKPKKGGVM